MDLEKIKSADILDIIFDGRNKEYGAYDLRKTYNKRMGRALAGMVGICAAAFLLAFAASKVKKTEDTEMLVQDVELKDLKSEEKKPEPPPPPPPPKQEPPKVEITKFTPPKIVKDEEVKPEEEIKDVEKLEDTKIGTINQEGEKNDVVDEPVEEQSAAVVEAPKVEEEDYDKEFKSVEIQAKYPGDWRKFLERNLNNNAPVDNGAPPGNYTVTVSFKVDKDGNVTEVEALNDPGYGTAAEAIRAVKKSGKWTPAIQNGRNVIYRQKQNITFTVVEE
jgi:protein TonB